MCLVDTTAQGGIELAVEGTGLGEVFGHDVDMLWRYNIPLGNVEQQRVGNVPHQALLVVTIATVLMSYGIYV